MIILADGIYDGLVDSAQVRIAHGVGLIAQLKEDTLGICIAIARYSLRPYTADDLCLLGIVGICDLVVSLEAVGIVIIREVIVYDEVHMILSRPGYDGVYIAESARYILISGIEIIRRRVAGKGLEKYGETYSLKAEVVQVFDIGLGVARGVGKGGGIEIPIARLEPDGEVHGLLQACGAGLGSGGCTGKKGEAAK